MWLMFAPVTAKARAKLRAGSAVKIGPFTNTRSAGIGAGA
jgi:hypothetical protein